METDMTVRLVNRLAAALASTLIIVATISPLAVLSLLM